MQKWQDDRWQDDAYGHRIAQHRLAFGLGSVSPIALLYYCDLLESRSVASDFNGMEVMPRNFRY